MHRNHLGQNQNPWWKPHFCTRHNFTCHWQLPRDLWTHWHIVWELLAPVRFTGPKAKWQKFPTLWRNLSGDVPPYLKEKKAYHRIHGKDFGVFIWLAKHVYVNVCVCVYIYIYTWLRHIFYKYNARIASPCAWSGIWPAYVGHNSKFPVSRPVTQSPSHQISCNSFWHHNPHSVTKNMCSTSLEVLRKNCCQRPI